MVTCKMAAPDTGTGLRTTGPVLGDYRQWKQSVRNCVPDKLGTDPTAYGGINKWDAAAELGRNPVSKHQIQPAYGKGAG